MANHSFFLCFSLQVQQFCQTLQVSGSELRRQKGIMVNRDS